MRLGTRVMYILNIASNLMLIQTCLDKFKKRKALPD